MNGNPFVREGCDVAWCPGCGNHAILKLMSTSMAELKLDRQRTVLVSGIGQAAKIPQYLEVHFFNGLLNLPPLNLPLSGGRLDLPRNHGQSVKLHAFKSPLIRGDLEGFTMKE